MKVGRNSGFTIVELLIVIIVIAILAAIALVTYAGIQNRAKNDQMVSGMVSYVKALSVYMADKNTYPIQTGYIACFGGVNDCNPSANAAQTAALASELAPYTNNASNTLLRSAGSLMNYTTNYTMPDGSLFTGMYVYFLQYGTTTCPSIGSPSFMYSSPSGANTVCRYALPVPT